MAQYLTLLDLIGVSGSLLKSVVARISRRSPQARAIITVIGIGMVTLGLGSAAALTSYVRLPMIALGAFYGVVLSYPVTRFLRPRIQSLVTAFLGGLTAGNIGREQARLSQAIASFSSWIKDEVKALHPGGTTEAADLNVAIIWGIWTCILIALAILAANAYFANQDKNPVGRPVDAQIPVVPPPVAGPGG